MAYRTPRMLFRALVAVANLPSWVIAPLLAVLGVAVLASLVSLVRMSADSGSEPWPVSVVLRHIAAAPNCAAARAVGLAPARWGEPGYYLRHDRDNDGIACEPWPRTPVGNDPPRVIYPSARPAQ